MIHFAQRLRVSSRARPQFVLGQPIAVLLDRATLPDFAYSSLALVQQRPRGASGCAANSRVAPDSASSV